MIFYITQIFKETRKRLASIRALVVQRSERMTSASVNSDQIGYVLRRNEVYAATRPTHVRILCSYEVYAAECYVATSTYFLYNLFRKVTLICTQRTGATSDKRLV